MLEKYLHPMDEARIKTILKRNDIRIEFEVKRDKNHPYNATGIHSYKVFDSNGKKLISYSDNYEKKVSTISLLGKTVAKVQLSDTYYQKSPEEKAVDAIGVLLNIRRAQLNPETYKGAEQTRPQKTKQWIVKMQQERFERR